MCCVFFLGGGGMKSLCVRWIPNVHSVTGAMVPTASCNEGPYQTTCYVGRLVSPPHILPGKYHVDVVQVYSNLNGASYGDGTKEVLEIIPGFQVNWLPNTAGHDIPTNAVVGGYLAAGVGSDLYVIRGVMSLGYTVIGYYDPASERGYVEYSGGHTATAMDMLVLV